MIKVDALEKELIFGPAQLPRYKFNSNLTLIDPDKVIVVRSFDGMLIEDSDDIKGDFRQTKFLELVFTDELSIVTLYSEALVKVFLDRPVEMQEKKDISVEVPTWKEPKAEDNNHTNVAKQDVHYYVEKAKQDVHYYVENQDMVGWSF